MTHEKELLLPRLIGSRSTARALLDELGQVQDQVVVVNARDLRSASPSSADEFVKVALVERGASRLKVCNAGRDFLEDLEESAKARNVSGRLAIPTLK